MDPSMAEYAAFEEKVKRTIYIDNLSPLVTEAVLRSAMDQFGTVFTVEFIPNYTEPKGMPQAALVEMETPQKAEEFVLGMNQYPFMISGMPRPVRVRPAEATMFADRPPKPGRKIYYRWLGSSHPDFGIAKKIKFLVKQQSAEAAFVLKHQLVEEAKLANHQAETLKAAYQKYELIESVFEDGSRRRLDEQYKMRILNR